MGYETSKNEFARLLVEHQSVFLRYVLTKVPNRADAHDIIQECSVALWGQFGSYDPGRFICWNGACYSQLPPCILLSE